MKITDFIEHLQSIAPLGLQENYDNAGLLIGNGEWDCTGVLVCLDTTDDVMKEAIAKKCNLIVAHHPVIFRGLKQITSSTYVERAVIHAIKHDIAIYVIHTNLDNVLFGVNGKIADKLRLVNRKILWPKIPALKKLYTFVPMNYAEQVRNALFASGGGHIGNYSECSFGVEGTGTFKGEDGTQPFVGVKGERHYESEIKIEVIFPGYLQKHIIETLIKAHPYEEVAYDIIELDNSHPAIGSGLLGDLQDALSENDFLTLLKKEFHLKVIRHTALLNRPVKKVAVCGGSGSFLVSKALNNSADVFITADIKYHDFFDADRKLLLCDIGHYESEQFTIDLIADILHQKFPNFAVLKTEVVTNPVHYYM